MAEFTASQLDYARFRALDAEILGVSVNAPHSQAIFAQMLKLKFPLLSDFRMEAMRKCGVKNPRREMALRSWFIVDKKGIIRLKHVARKQGDILPTKTLLRELRGIRGGGGRG